jgi:hypothetical protein
VRGAFRDSGEEAVLLIAAATQAQAEHDAVQKGMLVESCWPAHSQPAPTALPLPTPVTVERTSKRFKWQMLAGFLVAVFGICTGCLFAPVAASIRPGFGLAALVVGGLCFVGGLGWALSAKFLAWWHHG